MTSPHRFNSYESFTLREMCLYLEFFWSMFFHIRTENTPETSPNTDTFYALLTPNQIHLSVSSIFKIRWAFRSVARR